MSTAELPERAWDCALLSLRAMGPARYRLVRSGRTARQAWEALGSSTSELEGLPPRLVERWRAEIRLRSVAAIWERLEEADIGVLSPADPDFPAILSDDPEPPALLFHRGNLGALDAPLVAIVGTRRCTRYGADIAHRFAIDLSRAGVTVLSGLALGIDGAAHAGALAVDPAMPVAVVGSGLDRIYPRANAALWRAVERRGLVLSEAPLGSPPDRWRFPARNRIIAGLAAAVVVVESHATGGSLHTVDEAIRRGRPVLAVPGPIHSQASRGTNLLLSSGAVPALDPDDVLVAIGLSSAGQRHGPIDRAGPPGDLGLHERTVLDSLGWSPRSLDQLAADVDLDLTELATVVERLVARGSVERRDGWLERRLE